MIRSMMSQAILPISFWGYALETATHILNLVPTKKVSNTPFEMWKGKRPSPEHIQNPGVKSHWILFYKPKDNVVFVAQRGVFLEREMISKEYSGKVVTLVKHDYISLPIRRISGRVSKPPQFYYGFHIKEDKISDSTLRGFDYEETFSPVAKIKSIRIMLAIAAFHDYEIWQMDVKTAFLNGKLTDDVDS
ncbi:retrotransposon protein, putative, ty1-copia subclass [Tanacetum coccineum]